MRVEAHGGAMTNATIPDPPTATPNTTSNSNTPNIAAPHTASHSAGPESSASRFATRIGPVDSAVGCRSTTIATTIAPSERPRHCTPLLVELDREWARLRRRPQALRRVRSWSHDPALAPIVSVIRDLDELVRATSPIAGGVGSGDDILRSLITLATDDELAGRIVLQRILPGLISRSRRWDGHARGGDACDVSIGAAWLAIRTFDVRARSRHVAPSLIADALWIGFRRGARRKVEQEVPVPANVLTAYPAPAHEAAPLEALAGTLRAARRAGVPAADLELMRRIVVAGSPSQAARQCKVTVRTIRNRRDAATWKIRRALGPDWADWTDPVVAA